MGVVFMATADQGDVVMWTDPGTVAVSNTVARTGTYSFRGGSTAVCHKTMPARADNYLKAALLCSASSGQTSEIRFRESTTAHITVLFNFSSGAITVYRGTNAGTQLATTAASLMLNTWYCVEIYAKTHDSTGAFTLKVNGATLSDLTLTNADTRNGSTTGNADNIQFYSGGTYTYWDDIVIRDDTWPGTGGIYVLVPTGAGSLANWTASAGSAYQCVDELPASYADYISTDAATLNTKHDLAFGNMTGTFDSIPVVGVYISAKLDAAGSGNVRPYADSNGTTSSGTALALSTSAQVTAHYMALNPDGSAAWTKAAVDALIAGVETV